MGPPDSKASSQTLSLLGEALSRLRITFHSLRPLCYCFHLPEAMERGGCRAEHLGENQSSYKNMGLLEPQDTLLIASFNPYFI